MLLTPGQGLGLNSCSSAEPSLGGVPSPYTSTELLGTSPQSHGSLSPPATPGAWPLIEPAPEPGSTAGVAAAGADQVVEVAGLGDREGETARTGQDTETPGARPVQKKGTYRNLEGREVGA